MKPVRIFLLSGSRPSRAWKIADQIKREIPGAQVRGIVQRSLHLLPAVQQRIATNRIDHSSTSSPAVPGCALWLRFVLVSLLHWVLWCIHGCPRGLNVEKQFTIKDLRARCRQSGCGLLVVDRVDWSSFLEFSQNGVDLVIVVGDMPFSRESFAVPGVLRVHQDDASVAAETRQTAQIRIEHFTPDSELPFTVAFLDVPAQPYDGPLGLTLKADLMADDLLLQTVRSLQNGTVAQAADEVMRWAREMISPYLQQLQWSGRQDVPELTSGWRFRPTWKLCLDTLLLCSPFFVFRNWYRRWRGRYPVLILTHHLVSDRPHPMAISTENFWRQLRFLQRHYRLVSLVEAEKSLRSGDVTVPTVVLTFDDGYGDNFVNLRAVAAEMEIPVALFVTTQPVELHQEFQHDLANGSIGHLPLTWDQIRHWSLRGAEFGSHTRTHPDCGSADRTTLIEEIVGSKQDLEGHLRKTISFFAFPFGQPENLSTQAVQIAAAAYAHFASGLDGENLPGVVMPHLFRKNLYPNRWELELELQSVFRLINRWKQKFHGRQSRSGRSQPGLAASAFATSEEFSSAVPNHHWDG